jgi:hypothetical protein
MAVDYFIDQALALDQSWLEFLINKMWLITIVIVFSSALLKLAIFVIEKSEAMVEQDKSNTPGKKARYLKIIGLNLIVSVTIIVTFSGAFLLATKQVEQDKSKVSALAAYTLAQQTFYFKHGSYLNKPELENKFISLNRLSDFNVYVKQSQNGFLTKVSDPESRDNNSNNCLITVEQGQVLWSGGLCIDMKQIEAALTGIDNQTPALWAMQNNPESSF